MTAFTGSTAVAVCLLIATASMPASARADEAAAQVEGLRAELTLLRAQLAQTQLELKAALRELAEAQAFGRSDDPAGEIAQWRAEREELAAERQKLAAERKRMEQAKLTLQAAARQANAGDNGGGGGAVQAPPAAANGAGNAVPGAAGAPGAPNDLARPVWELDYKIAVVYTGSNYEKTYINPIRGSALVKSYPLIDRRHMMVRGTLQNRSTAPWRYTFEIRMGNEEGAIIGRWRHQTIVLGPNELAEFEVKVPVTDVGEITTYQIGNIEADRPAEAAAPAAPGAAGDAAPVRERVNR